MRSSFRRFRTRAVRFLRIVGNTTRFQWRNLFSRDSCVGGVDDVVVSLTSYGPRLKHVYLTIESIAAGKVKPRRLILWIDEPGPLNNPPRSLRRLQRRGLELQACNNYGPHKKYFPYASQFAPREAADLVTADDDMFYPRGWLEELLAARVESPRTVIAHRARQIAVRRDLAEEPELLPYADWHLASTVAPAFCIFPTGTGGVLYPRPLLLALAERGEAFEAEYWSADDIWLHSTAVKSGFRARQVVATSDRYLMLLGSQQVALFKRNHQEDGNDRMIATAYGPQLVGLIAADAARLDEGNL